MSARGVEALSKPGRYPDGGGLYLQVSPAGTKAWIFRYSMAGLLTANGKRGERQMGLGPYGERAPGVTLAEARRKAAAATQRLREGQDPMEARDTARTADAEARAKVAANSFQAVADRYMDTHLQGLSNPKHRAQWRSTLATYAYPSLGSRPVASITRMEVADALRPIWNTKRETAQRVVQRMDRVFRYAKAAGLRDGDNPASMRDGLSALLTAGVPGGIKGRRHHPALPWQQVPAFMVALRGKEGLAARALELAILTAARTGEVIGARWAEMDLDAGTWTVPAERMKAKRPHRKPLTPAAVALLRTLAPTGQEEGSQAFVFPGVKRGKPLSNMAMAMLIRGMSEGEPDQPPRWRDAKGDAVTRHGFRSTFRDWAGETGQPVDLAEAALAHVVRDKTEAAYARSDLFDRRRTMMEAWEAWCATPALPANVSRLRRAREA
ncbi:tyrosine-type recombinase/integrase [Roseomonas sp. BN140053]|uniref:tyrosine-type recombinase/integrase n=1 Tax=Roseomonas sp. BN140053 TaxID=3391898 RepID=UPI0039EAF628